MTPQITIAALDEAALRRLLIGLPGRPLTTIYLESETRIILTALEISWGQRSRCRRYAGWWDGRSAPILRSSGDWMARNLGRWRAPQRQHWWQRAGAAAPGWHGSTRRPARAMSCWSA